MVGTTRTTKPPLISQAEAFAVTTTNAPSSTTALHAESRRAFMSAAALFTAGAVLSAPAFADDDLSMPTEQEQAKVSEAEMAERLRKKAALQKKMVAPKNLGESFSKEMTNQKEQKGLTQQERRDKMCEELGRGC